MIKIGRSVGPVEEGNVYSGGSSDAVTKLFNAKGKDIMYIGDHIFGDILKSKKENGWRTFLVVPELSQELHIWSDNRDVYDKVRALDDVISEAYQNLDSSSKDVVDIRNIKKEFREAVHQQDMQYGMFGSMFRLVKMSLGTTNRTLGTSIIKIFTANPSVLIFTTMKNNFRNLHLRIFVVKKRLQFCHF